MLRDTTSATLVHLPHKRFTDFHLFSAFLCLQPGFVLPGKAVCPVYLRADACEPVFFGQFL